MTAVLVERPILVAEPQKGPRTKTIRLNADLADMVQVICDVETEEGEKVTSDRLLDPLIRSEITKRYLAALRRRQERTNRLLKQADKDKGK